MCWVNCLFYIFLKQKTIHEIAEVLVSFHIFHIIRTWFTPSSYRIWDSLYLHFVELMNYITHLIITYSSKYPLYKHGIGLFHKSKMADFKYWLKPDHINLNRKFSIHLFLEFSLQKIILLVFKYSCPLWFLNDILFKTWTYNYIILFKNVASYSFCTGYIVMGFDSYQKPDAQQRLEMKSPAWFILSVNPSSTVKYLFMCCIICRCQILPVPISSLFLIWK